jgi:mono/diheme cytochrome c family protein
MSAVLGAALTYLPGIASAQSSSPGRDIGNEARAVFAAKCAACHGPDLAKPKGRFGYVLDLRRVAKNPEMVIPGQPTESELWVLVQHDEMPPQDSPTGPLSPAQKETIRGWIAAGAPSASSSTISLVPQPEPEEPAVIFGGSESPPLLRRLGSLHVLLVHFPIALLICAAGGELWLAWRGLRTPTQFVRFCVLLGTAGALAAAALGWVQAWNGYGLALPRTLSLHRWIGTSGVLWAIGTAILSERDERRRQRSQSFRTALFIGAALIGVAGHLGGILVHGEDYFTWLP